MKKILLSFFILMLCCLRSVATELQPHCLSACLTRNADGTGTINASYDNLFDGGGGSGSDDQVKIWILKPGGTQTNPNDYVASISATVHVTSMADPYPVTFQISLVEAAFFPLTGCNEMYSAVPNIDDNNAPWLPLMIYNPPVNYQSTLCPCVPDIEESCYYINWENNVEIKLVTDYELYIPLYTYVTNAYGNPFPFSLTSHQQDPDGIHWDYFYEIGATSDILMDQNGCLTAYYSNDGGEPDPANAFTPHQICPCIPSYALSTCYTVNTDDDNGPLGTTVTLSFNNTAHTLYGSDIPLWVNGTQAAPPDVTPDGNNFDYTYLLEYVYLTDCNDGVYLLGNDQGTISVCQCGVPPYVPPTYSAPCLSMVKDTHGGHEVMTFQSDAPYSFFWIDLGDNTGIHGFYEQTSAVLDGVSGLYDVTVNLAENGLTIPLDHCVTVYFYNDIQHNGQTDPTQFAIKLTVCPCKPYYVPGCVSVVKDLHHGSGAQDQISFETDVPFNVIWVDLNDGNGPHGPFPQTGSSFNQQNLDHNIWVDLGQSLFIPDGQCVTVYASTSDNNGSSEPPSDASKFTICPCKSYYNNPCLTSKKDKHGGHDIITFETNVPFSYAWVLLDDGTLSPIYTQTSSAPDATNPDYDVTVDLGIYTNVAIPHGCLTVYLFSDYQSGSDTNPLDFATVLHFCSCTPYYQHPCIATVGSGLDMPHDQITFETDVPFNYVWIDNGGSLSSAYPQTNWYYDPTQHDYDVTVDLQGTYLHGGCADIYVYSDDHDGANYDPFSFAMHLYVCSCPEPVISGCISKLTMWKNQQITIETNTLYNYLWYYDGAGVLQGPIAASTTSVVAGGYTLVFNTLWSSTVVTALTTVYLSTSDNINPLTDAVAVQIYPCKSGHKDSGTGNDNDNSQTAAHNGNASHIDGVLSAQLTGVTLYPNPAKEMATLAFTLSNASDVQILVIDELGRIVNTINQSMNTGMQKVEINTASFVPGVYNVQVHTNGGLFTQRLSVVK